MHKSALLRYFETRDEIFLRLAADAWEEWSAAARAELGSLPLAGADTDARGALIRRVAQVLTATLLARPMFCDLLAQTPLNLERNVSFTVILPFKTVALREVAAVQTALQRLLPLRAEQAMSVVTTATGMAGALWQMTSMTSHLRERYEADPALMHALVDARQELEHILGGLLAGFTGTPSAAMAP